MHARIWRGMIVWVVVCLCWPTHAWAGEERHPTDVALERVLELEGALARKLGETNEAEQTDFVLAGSYEQVLSSPEVPKFEKLIALKSLAHVRFRQGRYAEVVEWCRRLSGEYPDGLPLLELEAEAKHLLASEDLIAGDFDRAIATYESLLALKLPSAWVAFCKHRLAYVYLLKDEDETATRLYEQIVKDGGNGHHWPAAALFSLARHHLQSEDRAAARHRLHQLLKKYPSSPWAGPAQAALEEIELK